MNVLVINCGSSSIKYQLFDMHDETVLTSGQAERIGEADSRLVRRWRNGQGEFREQASRQSLPDHRAAFGAIEAALREPQTARALDRLGAVGHRVVHGGERFCAPARITAEVRDGIAALCQLAPLHNPQNLTGIDVCLDLFPQVAQVAVFDTAFHHSMPAHACRYAIPDAWYRQHRVRRYGFHGTSHACVMQRTADWLHRPPESLNLITLHLGNGASAAAIRAGRCVDTSMGFTPLEGLMMGTRSGDIDAAIALHIGRQTGAEPGELEAMLNHDSGLKGVCGASDMREVEHMANSGNAAAELAVAMYGYRVRKYIGAYYAVLGRVDALVFTAGVGENSPLIRARACEGLEKLGISIDAESNAAGGNAAREIQAAAADVKVLVVPTNEELEIARQAATCLASA